jgi:NAD-dependent SIR2 family protein deacetylase
MPSEKAKENKTLTAQCAACGKTVSTELIHGVQVVHNHRRTTVPVCDDCREKGWQPSSADAG